MGSRLGRRVVHFVKLPIKLLMPSSFNSIKEIALKTIPSTTKIEIMKPRGFWNHCTGLMLRRFEHLTWKGKRRREEEILHAKPDYKKAYVTLKYPLSISSYLYPIRVIEDEEKRLSKESKSGIVDDNEQEVKSNWLEGSGNKHANMRDMGLGIVLVMGIMVSVEIAMIVTLEQLSFPGAVCVLPSSSACNIIEFLISALITLEGKIFNHELPKVSQVKLVRGSSSI